jgi:MFS family permease
MDTVLSLAMDPAAWVALVALIAMEIVLGIDNLVFIAILTNKLPENQRSVARRMGIAVAVILRLMLLGAIAVIVSLVTPLFRLFGQDFSWRDLILIAGGLFLVWKATKEIHHRVDPDPGPDLFDGRQATLGFAAAIGQIVMLDLVFSIDSIITAVGMTSHVPIYGHRGHACPSCSGRHAERAEKSMLKRGSIPDATLRPSPLISHRFHRLARNNGDRHASRSWWRWSSCWSRRRRSPISLLPIRLS